MGVNVYELVTQRIIAELEKGIIPWSKPWTGASNGAYSRSTGKPYSLLNQLLLPKAGEYLTFHQARAAGGHIRKGEKSHIIVFWNQVKVAEEENGTQQERLVPMLRYYNVFHIDQTEGVKPKFQAEERPKFSPIEEAEQLIHTYLNREGIRLQHILGDKASYSPNGDIITLPKQEQFKENKEYYSTLFHETVHSTGHKSRLARLNGSAHFGNEDYSKEELIAEIGAAALMNQMGLETAQTFQNSSAYIQGWIEALRKDIRLITAASSKAEKAIEYIIRK